MLDRVVVEMIAREQNADAGLSAKVISRLTDRVAHRFSGSSTLPELQISFGQQVKVLRLAGMLLNLVGQFSRHPVACALRRERRAVVEIVEEMLIRIRARSRHSSTGSEIR